MDKIGIIDKNMPLVIKLMHRCKICPRRCGVDRFADEKGFCGVGKDMIVSSIGLHHGEAPPLSGRRGSGTIFFGGCNLCCLFCQNHQTSHELEGQPISTKELAAEMIALQKKGAHNINLVTPTHLALPIMQSLKAAYVDGLEIPIVYNCGGYESLETLQLFDGVVDIYMPDMKYGDNAAAEKLSSASDYVEINQVAILEMQRQVGVLRLNNIGTAEKGLLIRHLVLPNGIGGTENVLNFIAKRVSKDTYINLMSQYFPHYRALEHSDLSRQITPEEYHQAKLELKKCGLHNGWLQNVELN